jgi:putative peptide zinc metalloprotease protein
MIQLRPTFSESWYRVNNLKARLRSSAQISRQFYRGERWYVVRDPAGNQFHRLSDAAYRFIGLLDGTRTIEQAWEICGGQLADDAPTQPEIIQILSHLYSANLIEADVTPDATVLLRRHKQLNKRKMQNRLMNVLFPRIPLWDPDRFLVRWMPAVKPVLSKLGAIIWLIVVISAITYVAPHWDELKKGASNAIDPKNWLWLWGVFVLIKLIHELGHAFACRRFGGECHELGIMFLVFIPTPYVDASSAWAFPNRWHRMFVGCAGMIVELFVASLLAFFWVTVGDKSSLPAVLAYNAMLIASVSTLIFNANPLLRYDGYYILSDFLEIPNLRQKSTEYAMGLIKRHIFRIKAQQPLPPVGQRFWLFFYAVASSIYRVFVGFIIILVVAYKIPVLGLLMAIGGVATWAIVPVFKLSKYLMLEPELHRKRGRAALFSGAVAALVIVLIGIIPFSVYVDGQGIVEANDHSVIHAEVPGFVMQQITTKDGQLLHKGDVILVLENRELQAQMNALQAQMRSLKAQEQLASVVDQAQMKIVQAAMEAVQQQIDDAQRKIDALTIRAPIEGTLIAPHLKEIQGSYLQHGQEVATVAAMNDLIVRAMIDQEQAELVHAQAKMLLEANPSQGKNDRVQVMFSGDIRMRDAVPASAERIIAASQDTVAHPSLLIPGGGDIAADPSDPKGEHPLVKQFEVRVRVANPPLNANSNPQGQYYPGQRAYVRFTLNKEPLIYRWARKFLQLLQSHENDSKLT